MKKFLVLVALLLVGCSPKYWNYTEAYEYAKSRAIDRYDTMVQFGVMECKNNVCIAYRFENTNVEYVRAVKKRAYDIGNKYYIEFEVAYKWTYDKVAPEIVIPIVIEEKIPYTFEFEIYFDTNREKYGLGW